MASLAQSLPDSTQSSSVTIDTSQPDADMVEDRPQNALGAEWKMLNELFETINSVAPHMAGSFVLNRTFWRDNDFKPGIQVTCVVKLRGKRSH
jgi:hypothetical protein